MPSYSQVTHPQTAPLSTPSAVPPRPTDNFRGEGPRGYAAPPQVQPQYAPGVNPYAQVQQRGMFGSSRGEPRGEPRVESRGDRGAPRGTPSSSHDDGGGWTEVSSSRRTERTYDPDRRLKQSYNQVVSDADRAADHPDRKIYTSVDVDHGDLKSLHRALRKDLDGQIIQTYPNGTQERFYVSSQQAHKNGGFNVTSHVWRGDTDLSKRDNELPRVNIHVVSN